MRILLLPVTKSRSAIFCQRQAVPSVRSSPRLDDRLASKGEKLWRSFETSDRNWKKFIVKWVGKLLDTVQFEETCLRTLPPRNTWQRQIANSESHVPEKQAIKKSIKLEPIELVYPSSALSTRDFNAAHSIIVHQAKLGLAIHKKQMLWCFLGLPLTIPFALNPFIPNVPGFYLIYRIWCNFKAYKAAQHLQYLSQLHQLKGVTFKPLDDIYENFEKDGRITAEIVGDIADLFNDNQLRRELNHAVRQVDRIDSKEKRKSA